VVQAGVINQPTNSVKSASVLAAIFKNILITSTIQLPHQLDQDAADTVFILKNKIQKNNKNNIFFFSIICFILFKSIE
jgi:hypothetical protein